MHDRGFGELLRKFRSAAGLSQEELAERARLSPGAISTLERRARRAPQQQTLGLLAEALQLDQSQRAELEAAAMAGRRRGARSSAGGDAPTPHNLPNVPTSFRGREAEVAELVRLMATRRVVTLLGPGGVGKTRLALEAARETLGSSTFADGIWFVELAPLGSSQLVTAAIARLLGVREQTSEPLLDTVVSAIGAKRMLLVLDNCEHVVDECARVAERVSRDCAGAVVLATTREALRLNGECVMSVEPLAYEPELAAGPALDLLVDRLVDADFSRFTTMTDDDRAQAATICRHLDGIPLALELAAGRARDLRLANIVDGLNERFTLLAQGNRTAMPRQQTLRGMIDWSFALLTPAEQQLFARLGLFAEAFTPEAAVAICAEDARLARDGLAALIAKSLVGVVEDRTGRLRYRLLETMRAYALERLRESGDIDRCSHRFAQYFCAFAAEADARYGRISNADFLASVEPDLENFRAALEWTLGQRQDTALGGQLAGALGFVYRQSSLFAEGARWCERALMENNDLDALVSGRIHIALSYFYFNMGEIQRALDAAGRATASYRQVGGPSKLSWSLTQEAYCLYLLGRAADAREAAAEAVTAGRAQSDPLRLAAALNALALTIPIQRAPERFAPLEEAIRLYRAAGDEGAIVPTANLAETHYAVGNFEAALSCGLDVVAMTRKNRDRWNLAAALTNVAAYALTLDDVQQAADAAHEALGLVRDVGKTLNTMLALQHLGSVAARRGEHTRAALLAGASNRLYEEFGLEREFTEQSLYDGLLAEIRGALGEEQMHSQLEAGSRLPLERVLDEVLTGV